MALLISFYSQAIAEIESEYSFDEDLDQKKLIHVMGPNGHVATHHVSQHFS